MTRDIPQGAHETPAWLGDFKWTSELTVAEEREPVPPSGIPLWPSEPASGPASGEREAGETTGPAHDRADPAHDETDPANDRAGPAHDKAGPAPLAHEGADLMPLGIVAVTGRRPMRPPSSPRRVRRRPRLSGSARGLLVLVPLALLAAFLAWVTAEPVWLAVGHSVPGTVTVTRCVDHGLDRRCTGTFTSTAFTRTAVPVMGDVPDPGASAPATMTSDRGARAYVDVDAFSRAAVGLVLIMLCGLGIVRGTAVRRLEPARARTAATLLSMAGPAALLAGMLTTTY